MEHSQRYYEKDLTSEDDTMSSSSSYAAAAAGADTGTDRDMQQQWRTKHWPREDQRELQQGRKDWINIQKVVRQSFQEVFKALESHKASQISLWDRFQAMEPQLQRYTVDSAGGGGDARDSIRTEELSSAIEETSRHLYRNDEHLVKLAKRVENLSHLLGENEERMTGIEDEVSSSRQSSEEKLKHIGSLVKKCKSTFTECKSILGEELPQLKNAVNEVVAKQNEFAEQRDYFNSEMSRLIGNVQQENSSMKKRLGELEAAYSSIKDTCELTNTDMDDRIKALENRLKQAENSAATKVDIADLEERLASKADKASVAKALHGKENKAKIRSRLDDVESELTALDGKVSGLEHAHAREDQDRSRVTQIESLKTKVGELENSVNTCKHKLNTPAISRDELLSIRSQMVDVEQFREFREKCASKFDVNYLRKELQKLRAQENERTSNGFESHGSGAKFASLETVKTVQKTLLDEIDHLSKEIYLLKTMLNRDSRYATGLATPYRNAHHTSSDPVKNAASDTAGAASTRENDLNTDMSDQRSGRSNDGQNANTESSEQGHTGPQKLTISRRRYENLSSSYEKNEGWESDKEFHPQACEKSRIPSSNFVGPDTKRRIVRAAEPRRSPMELPEDTDLEYGRSTKKYDNTHLDNEYVESEKAGFAQEKHGRQEAKLSALDGRNVLYEHGGRGQESTLGHMQEYGTEVMNTQLPQEGNGELRAYDEKFESQGQKLRTQQPKTIDETRRLNNLVQGQPVDENRLDLSRNHRRVGQRREHMFESDDMSSDEDSDQEHNNDQTVVGKDKALRPSSKVASKTLDTTPQPYIKGERLEREQYRGKARKERKSQREGGYLKDKGEQSYSLESDESSYDEDGRILNITSHRKVRTTAVKSKAFDPCKSGEPKSRNRAHERASFKRHPLQHDQANDEVTSPGRPQRQMHELPEQHRHVVKGETAIKDGNVSRDDHASSEASNRRRFRTEGKRVSTQANIRNAVDPKIETTRSGSRHISYERRQGTELKGSLEAKDTQGDYVSGRDRLRNEFDAISQQRTHANEKTTHDQDKSKTQDTPISRASMKDARQKQAISSGGGDQSGYDASKHLGASLNPRDERLPRHPRVPKEDTEKDVLMGRHPPNDEHDVRKWRTGIVSYENFRASPGNDKPIEGGMYYQTDRVTDKNNSSPETFLTASSLTQGSDRGDGTVFSDMHSQGRRKRQAAIDSIQQSIEQSKKLDYDLYSPERPPSEEELNVTFTYK